jgi:hypothetical protein
MRRILLALAVIVAPLDAAAQERPTVAIIGTGNLARVVGPALGAQAYTVVYGSRDPDRESVRSLVARTGATSSATGQRAAAARADVVILAVPARVIPEVSTNLGDLTGKVIVTVAGAHRRVGSDGYFELTGDSTYEETGYPVDIFPLAFGRTAGVARTAEHRGCGAVCELPLRSRPAVVSWCEAHAGGAALRLRRLD